MAARNAKNLLDEVTHVVDVQQEFDKNTDAQLSDSDIKRARLLIGVDVANKSQEHISRATYDSIRNFALGVGDDNPLFIDDEYGPSTRWGTQIAPNSMSQIINAPMLGDPMPEDVKKVSKGLFRGIHVYVSGGTTDWYRPIYPGDRLCSYSGEESVEVKNSEFAGRSVIQINRSVKLNQRGEVVAVYRMLRVLTERKTAKERGKYSRHRSGLLYRRRHRGHRQRVRQGDATRQTQVLGRRRGRGQNFRVWPKARSPSPRLWHFTPAATVSCPTG